MRIHYRISHFIVKSILKIFFGLKIKGGEKVPQEEKIILASNHQSYVDPPLVGVSVTRELYYLAKAELFKIPLLSYWIRKHNAIPINRSGLDVEAIKTSSRILDGDHALLLFPEGTRSRNGRLRDAKSGIGLIAYLNRADIIPLHISGTFKILRNFFKPPGIVVTFGERLKISEYLNATGTRREIYRRVSNDIMKRIRELRIREGGN